MNWLYIFQSCCFGVFFSFTYSWEWDFKTFQNIFLYSFQCKNSTPSIDTLPSTDIGFVQTWIYTIWVCSRTPFYLFCRKLAILHLLKRLSSKCHNNLMKMIRLFYNPQKWSKQELFISTQTFKNSKINSFFSS